MSGISLGSWHWECLCGSHPALVLHALSPQKTVWLQIFLCNCIILYLSCSSFIPKFINHLFKCKPISMVGAEQVRRNWCIGCHIWWVWVQEIEASPTLPWAGPCCSVRMGFGRGRISSVPCTSSLLLLWAHKKKRKSKKKKQNHA